MQSRRTPSDDEFKRRILVLEARVRRLEALLPPSAKEERNDFIFSELDGSAIHVNWSAPPYLNIFDDVPDFPLRQPSVKNRRPRFRNLYVPFPIPPHTGLPV
jgi:hypothetical protein